MWSDYSLEVVDAVARNGSFTGAAQELHRVPSARFGRPQISAKFERTATDGVF